MPYRFEFYDEDDADPRFMCGLASVRCSGQTKAGRRCARTAHTTLPYCWYHLRKEKFVTVADSNIHGKGLFAYDRQAERDGLPVFAAGSGIMRYDGENLSNAELDARYGEDSVAPYAVGVDGEAYDAACRRGAAANANTIFFGRGARPRHRVIRGTRVPVSPVTVRGGDGVNRRLSINAIIVNANDGMPYFEAIKDIHHMEEIVVYYGTTYDSVKRHRTRYVRR